MLVSTWKSKAITLESSALMVNILSRRYALRKFLKVATAANDGIARRLVRHLPSAEAVSSQRICLQPHGAAFLLWRISATRQSQEEGDSAAGKSPSAALRMSTSRRHGIMDATRPLHVAHAARGRFEQSGVGADAARRHHALSPEERRRVRRSHTIGVKPDATEITIRG